MSNYTITLSEEEIKSLEKLKDENQVVAKILKTVTKAEKRRKVKKDYKNSKLVKEFSSDLEISEYNIKEVPQKIKDVAEKFREDLVKNQTPSEVLVKAHLKSLGYAYEFQKIFYITPHKFYIADFYLKDYNIVIEIDGGYHFVEEQRIKDGIRTSDLKKYGVISVLRITNGQCRNDERSRTLIKNKISGVLGNLKARKASITAKAKNNRKKK